MQDGTPFYQLPLDEVRRGEACQKWLLEYAPRVSYIFEGLCGLGYTGGLFTSKWPQVRVQACDLDAACVRDYNRRLKDTKARATKGDVLDRFATYTIHLDDWAASLDFNRFSLLDLIARHNWRSEILDRVMSRDPSWVLLADSSCKSLHLNWQRYKLARADFACYLTSMDTTIGAQYDYRIAAAAKHRNAAYLLLVPAWDALGGWQMEFIASGIVGYARMFEGQHNLAAAEHNGSLL